MTSPRRIRLAVVGVGHLGRQHARVASQASGVDFVGVHDHHEGRAEEVAASQGLAVLGSLEEVAAAAEAVIVATPTSSHAEVGGFFLDRGIDVLVEKPITVTVAEADELVARARRHRRILQVGHIERHNPAVEAALRLVSEPRFIEVHRLGTFSPRSLDIDVVLDLMIHDLQIVRTMVGRPVVEIRAAGVPVLTPRLDIANARIAFEGGCVANLTASRVSMGRARKCRVFAASLYVSVDMQARSLAAFRLSQESGRPEIVPVEVSVVPEEPLARQLGDFLRAVRQRTEPLVPGGEGRDALVLAHRVLEAISEYRRAAEEVRA
ncbi:MAG: Gfo/Idh/MocA family protein [Thermoanaerobaculia bacterium]